jgi:hypothetical protein
VTAAERSAHVGTDIINRMNLIPDPKQGDEFLPDDHGFALAGLDLVESAYRMKDPHVRPLRRECEDRFPIAAGFLYCTQGTHGFSEDRRCLKSK